VIATIPLPPSEKPLHFPLVNCFLPRGKLQHSAIVEAKDPFCKMAPMSMIEIYKVLHNIYRMWMFRWVCPYHVTGALVCQAFGCTYGYPCSCSGSGKPCHAIVEANDPFKMAPTSISNTYKVFHNFYMMWMCMWIYDFVHYLCSLPPNF